MKICLRNSCCRSKSHKLNLICCCLLRRQNSAAETKIFTKVLQYTQSAGRCRLDLLCKLVAQCFPYPLVVLIKRIRELALTNSSCQYVIGELLSTCKFNHILLSQFEHGTDLAVI